MSGEHIWSAWIGELLDPERKSRYTFKRKDKDGVLLKTWQGDELDWTIRVVCETCNNNWMSDLENNHAKPTLTGILLGRPVSLLPTGIASLAAFAFKMIVVTDHMRVGPNSRRPFFKESVRASFRRSLRIPSNVQMWLAAYVEQGLRNGVLRSYYVTIGDSRYGDFQYFVLTYGISPFLVQVVARRWVRPLVPKTQPVPRLIQNEFWSDIPEFWPANGTALSWPPKKCLTGDVLATFANRFMDLRANS